MWILQIDTWANRKFGKTIQKRQLDIPEYAAYFVDYKALKRVCDICLGLEQQPLLTIEKLIKRLSATPVIQPQEEVTAGNETTQDPQASLQANKATFFFRLERELDKVNAFYLHKEGEVCSNAFLDLLISC
jgi:CDK inhibitor PHO81